MNAPSFFEIQADDVKRAIAFYQRSFGWTFTRAEGLPIEYWRIETGGPRGGLLQRPARPPAPQQGTNAFVCTVVVDDYDATERRIVDAGGQVALPKMALTGMAWQGYYLDTEGNTFGVHQPDPNAA